ncbi:MAG TPA: DUF4390 domain-containing protein [Kofleriaceae bacterium]|nr:DUF4390 domain-containing protein [Kofleriaceae bacterium]
MRAALAALGAAVALLAAPARAAADDSDVPYRRMGFAERGGNLAISGTLVDLIDAEAYGKLSSGFPTVMTARFYVYRKGQTERPIATAFVKHELIYDLWDELYVVRISGRELRFRSRTAAVRAMTDFVDLPIAKLDRIAIGPHYFVAMFVQLNPVSPELQAEMRRWLSRPAGEALDSSSSFFGSFVSVFVNPKLDRADRTMRLRSQPFYRTPR